LESTTDNPDEADVVITTAHKAKGLEWPKVKLSNDFKTPTDNQNPTNEETNILYVAASRALNKLDLSECQAAWNQTFDMAKKISHEQYLIDQTIEQDFKQVVNKNIKDLQKDYPCTHGKE
jgi:superfamily I DNA/RNA helicase